MIRNDDKTGHWQVVIRATTKQVACFQCPTAEDADNEARSLAACRERSGLPSQASRYLITGKDRKGLILGPEVRIDLQPANHL